MSRLTDNLTALIGVKNNIKDAIENKGVDMTGVPFTSYHEKILEIEGGGGSNNEAILDPEINVLLGFTMPIATKNGGESFWLEHESGVTISGLEGYATITGNGTERVEWTITETGSTDLIIPYTITLGNGETYLGRQFYYGVETSDWVVLAVKHRPETGVTGNFTDNWILIQSATAPPYDVDTDLGWNGVLKSQILSFTPNSLSSRHGSARYGFKNYNQPLTFTGTGPTHYSSSYLFCDWTNYNQPIDTSSWTSLNIYGFMVGCYAHKQKFNLNNLETIYISRIDADIFYGLTEINLPNLVGTFMYPFKKTINIPINLPNVTAVNSFLKECYAFNQPVNLPNVINVSSDFMTHCYSFNSTLNIPQLSNIANNFMAHCYSFDQTLELTEVTTVGHFFMAYCNKPRTVIMPNLKTVGNHFMYQTIGYNSTVNFPNLETVGTYFYSIASGVGSDMYYYSNHAEFNLPKLKTIGDYFLNRPYMNSKLNLPVVETINNYFLSGCVVFNQPLDLKTVKSIGSHFLNGAQSFNNVLILRDLETIGTNFMFQYNSLSLLNWEVDVYPSDSNSLARTSANTEVSPGIKITGTYANGLKNALPNSVTSPYRKLV